MREILTSALEESAPADINAIVEIVLRTLSQQKMISYAPTGELSLLTTHGRTLVAIMEDPGITLRALAVYLGVSESNAQKSVKALLDMGLIAKTKVKGRNVHKIIPKTLLNHSDINHVTSAVRAAERQEKEENLPF